MATGPIIPSFTPLRPGVPNPAYGGGRVLNAPSFDGIPAGGGPPNASAAPKPSNNSVGSGLVAALNNYQLTLLNNKDATGNPKPLIQIPD